MTPEIAMSDGHLFSIEPAEQIRYRAEKAHTGNMVYEGENPPAGAIIDFWSAEDRETAEIIVFSEEGAQVASMEFEAGRGLNRLVWDLRHTRQGLASDSGGFSRASRGPLVIPGDYTVRLSIGSIIAEERVEVREDPRLSFEPGVRVEWTETLLDVWDLVDQAEQLAQDVGSRADRLDLGTGSAVSDPLESRLRDLERTTGELVSRLNRLYGSIQGWIGPLAADQEMQSLFLRNKLAELSEQWKELDADLSR
tara:strand:+ start:168 stop:923 length:756 start_codon:yes stop_codon:yes gene_type:complete